MLIKTKIPIALPTMAAAIEFEGEAPRSFRIATRAATGDITASCLAGPNAQQTRNSCAAPNAMEVDASMPGRTWTVARPDVLTGFRRFTNYPLWVAQQPEAGELELDETWDMNSGNHDDSENPVVSLTRLERPTLGPRRIDGPKPSKRCTVRPPNK